MYCLIVYLRQAQGVFIKEGQAKVGPGLSVDIQRSAQCSAGKEIRLCLSSCTDEMDFRRICHRILHIHIIIALGF